MKKDKIKSLIGLGIVLILVAVFIVVMVSITNSEAKFTIEEDTLVVSGIFGKEFSLKDATIELRDDIPEITRKIKGSGLKEVKKGTFMVKELGECSLYIHNMNSSCIVINTNDETVLISLKEENSTIELYNRIRNEIEQ